MAAESVLWMKPEVTVYRIPPRASSRGHRAADWKLHQPDWTGCLRVTTKGDLVYIKLEDRVSGELFAEAPVESYPGVTVEGVTDSSRYFALRIQDGSDVVEDVTASGDDRTSVSNLGSDRSSMRLRF